MSKAEKKVADDRIAGIEAGNKSLEKWMGTLGQIGVAIGVAKVAFDAFGEYAHHLDLQSAAAGVSIQKLRVASHGLKTDMELLEHAAILNNTAFKLTQEQMGTVETAMRTLESRGRDSAEVWGAMESALQKGSIGPLEKLGIIIDKTGLKMDENGVKLDTYGSKQQALERIMKGLANTAREVDGEQMNAADSMGQTIVKLHNYWDEAKLKLGELVTKLGPLLEGLSHAVDQATKLVSVLPGGSGAWMGGGLEGMSAINGISGGFEGLLGGFNPFSPSETKAAADMRRRLGWKGFNSKMHAGIDAVPAYDAFGAKMGAGTFDAGTFVNATNRFAKAAEDWEKAMKGDGIEYAQIGSRGFDRSSPKKHWLDQFGRPHEATGFERIGAQGMGGIEQFDVQGLSEQQQRAFIEEQTRGSRYDAYMKSGRGSGQTDSFLAKTLGPLEEFDAYAKAFDMLGNAVSSGMNAWITDSMSAGMAIKKAIGEALSALSSQMAIEGLKHTAYAIGSLAFGDVRGAGTHAAAAAAFGVGAAAAAVAAREFGHGGKDYKPPEAPKETGGGKGAGAGGSGGGSGSGKGDGGRTVIVAYLDPFAQSTPSERGRNARKMVQTVLGGDAGTDS